MSEECTPQKEEISPLAAELAESKRQYQLLQNCYESMSKNMLREWDKKRGPMQEMAITSILQIASASEGIPCLHIKMICEAALKIQIPDIGEIK